MFEFFKTLALGLWAVIKDFFSRQYTYHASTIAFSSFLVLNTAVIFLGTVIKYIPHREFIIKKIYEIFPNVAEQVVSLLVKEIETLSVKAQIFTLILVVIFIGNFLRTVEIAFAYVVRVKPRPLPWIHYVLPFIFGFLMVFYGIADVVIKLIPQILIKFHVYHPFVIKILEAVKIILNYLAFPLGLFTIYFFISPIRLSFRITLAVSIVLMMLLNPLKEIFTWYITHFLLKNLVITPFAGILIFLIWLYIMAIFILLGYRLIVFLQEWEFLKGKH